jgi:hypothetical protein
MNPKVTVPDRIQKATYIQIGGFRIATGIVLAKRLTVNRGRVNLERLLTDLSAGHSAGMAYDLGPRFQLLNTVRPRLEG